MVQLWWNLADYLRNLREKSKYEGSFHYMCLTKSWKVWGEDKRSWSQSLFQLNGSDWGQSWVSVADSLTLELLTKVKAWFKHLSSACIIKCHRDSVVLHVRANTANALAAGRLKKNKKVLNGARYYWLRSKAILISLRGIFSNNWGH